MSEAIVHPVPESFAINSNLTVEQYQRLYQQSIDDPETFWAEQAERFVDWYQPWSKVSEVDFGSADIQWFQEGKLNVSYNCLDRHLDQHGDKVPDAVSDTYDTPILVLSPGSNIAERLNETCVSVPSIEICDPGNSPSSFVSRPEAMMFTPPPIENQSLIR